MRHKKQSVPVKKLVSLFVIGLLMSACAASPDGQGGSNSTPQPGNSGQSSAKANKIDACALVPKADAETVLGQSVKSAAPGRATEGTQSTAAFSECTYQLDGAKSVILSARRSPVADNTPEAIKRVRDTMKEVTGKEAADVNGLGDTAFWTGTKQLHVFQGGDTYLYVTMMGFKDDAEAKAKAIDMMRRGLTNLPK